MALFFFFDSMRMNLLLYFTITTIVLYLGPEYFLSGLRKQKEAPLLEPPCGKLIGRKLTTRNGRSIDAYNRIPYAKPPVGALRFRRPEPLHDPWEGSLQAKTEPPGCVQKVDSIHSLLFSSGQEDCLYLNVYKPSDHVNSVRSSFH